MKISVVTISFNQAKFLEQAIRSVIDQPGVDLEYIVVDPGSTDGSRDIIEKYRSRISRIVFEKDKGPADGLNKGFSHATGDILGYLNADDVFLPGVLKEVVDEFTSEPNIDVLSAHGYVIDGDGNKRQKIYSNKLSSSRFVRQRFTAGYSIIVQPSTFFTKTIFQKAGGFDNAYRMMWDAALAVDFMNLHARFKVLNRVWSCFRMYDDSITGSVEQNMDKTLKTFQALQKRAAIDLIPAWKYPILRSAGWIFEPSLYLRRLNDQFSNRNRIKWVLPKPQ